MIRKWKCVKCKTPKCNNPVLVNGLCASCKSYLMKHGNPLKEKIRHIKNFKRRSDALFPEECFKI